MSADDYDRFRLQLEAQLRDDVELLYAAYRTKLQAYETVWRARGEIAGAVSWEPPPAASLPAGLGPLLAAAEPAPRPVQPPAPVPVAAPPARKKAAQAFALYNDIFDALEQHRIGEVFDKNDLCRALGYTPPRATLYRALQELVDEKVIVGVAPGSGRNLTRYRRAPSGTGLQPPN